MMYHMYNVLAGDYTVTFYDHQRSSSLAKIIASSVMQRKHAWESFVTLHAANGLVCLFW